MPLLPIGIASLVLVTAPAPPATPVPEPAYDGKPLSQWARQLKSDKEEDRRRAAEALAGLAIESRRAVPALLGAIGGKGVNEAVEALVRIGPAAVPALTAALWDEDRARRAAALYVLGLLGDRARPATAAVTAALGDCDPLVRGVAAQTLGRIGPPSAVPALLPLLDQEDEVRRSALLALLDLRAEARVVVPILVKWLRAEDVPQRRLAAGELGGLGPEAVPAVAALVEALKDEGKGVRADAIRSLGRIGPGARAAVPALSAVLAGDGPAEDRLAAAEALWLIAQPAEVAAALKRWPMEPRGGWRVPAALLLWRIDKGPEAVAALADVIAHGKLPDRLAALDAVRWIGPGARAALPALTPALRDKDPYLRTAAALALGRLGRHGRPAARDLAALLGDEDAHVRLAAALALWQGGDPEGLKRLVAGLRAADPEVRAEAAMLLSFGGRSAKDAAPALRAALADGDASVRRAAAGALGMIDDGPETLTALVEALRDRNGPVRDAAALALGGGFGARAAPAVPGLVKALWDEEPQVRSDAAEALGRIGPGAKAATAALVAVLGSPDLEPAPSAAAEALGLIGPAARPALPALREAL
jgi:HEAT repeat protein